MRFSFKSNASSIGSDPSVTLVMDTVAVADAAATTIMTVPGFVDKILTDRTTFRRQARQPRQGNRSDTRLLISATAVAVLGLGLMGFPSARDLVSLIASFL